MIREGHTRWRRWSLDSAGNWRVRRVCSTGVWHCECVRRAWSACGRLRSHGPGRVDVDHLIQWASGHPRPQHYRYFLLKWDIDKVPGEVQNADVAMLGMVWTCDGVEWWCLRGPWLANLALPNPEHQGLRGQLPMTFIIPFVGVYIVPVLSLRSSVLTFLPPIHSVSSLPHFLFLEMTSWLQPQVNHGIDFAWLAPNPSHVISPLAWPSCVCAPLWTP